MNNQEVDFIANNMEQFMKKWAAHGKELFANFELIEPYFLVVAVDDSKVPPSGCSIDASVHFIQELQTHLDLDFFDRLNVAYQKGEEINLEHINKLTEKVEDNDISSDILVFDNLVETLGEMKQNWLKPMQDTWVASRLS